MKREEKKELPKKPLPSPDIETDAEEIARKLQTPLNQRQNIFDETQKLQQGINSAPSVFEKKTVFFTGNNGQS